MKKRTLCLIIVIVLLLSVISGCGQGVSGEEKNDASDYVITDLLGREVTIPGDAETFVAIGPGCLRLYCYVADVSKLVGIEELELSGISNRPYMAANDELISLDIIGAGGPANAPDAEKLLVAGPDVIFSLYNADVATVDELQQKTDIPVVALSYGETEMFDQVINQSLELIGKVTGNEERADEVIEYFAQLKDDLATRVKGIQPADKPLAYMGCMGMRGTHGIESTTGNFSIFSAIGVRNAVDEAGISDYVMLDKEKLLEMDPDYIFLDGAGLSLVYEDYAENAEFYNGLQAFKNGNVYMHMPYNYYYTNIGVAIADSYYIGSILYPDEFSDIDPAAKFDEIVTKLLGEATYSKMAQTFNGGYQNLKFE